MLNNPALAHNMQMVVTALVAPVSHMLCIDFTTYTVADHNDGMQYVVSDNDCETYDDRNDALFMVMHGGADYAFMVLPNVNYPDDQVDIIIFSKGLVQAHTQEEPK